MTASNTAAARLELERRAGIRAQLARLNRLYGLQSGPNRERTADTMNRLRMELDR